MTTFHPRGLLILCMAWLASLQAPAHAQQPTTSTQTQAPAQRIITLAPNITETLFAMGLGERVVGVTDFCTYPPQARERRSCGGWSNPSFETISALKPDLILIQAQHQKMREFARQHDMRVEGVNMDSLASTYEGIEQIGRWTGAQDQATSLTHQIQHALAKLAAKAPPEDKRPAVFVSISRQAGSLSGIYTAAGGSFLDEAITLAGGRNIFTDITQPYPQASKESLLMRRPQVILELVPELEDDSPLTEQYKADWQSLQAIPAVQKGNIFVLTEDYLLIPGPRIPQIVERIQQALQSAQPCDD